MQDVTWSLVVDEISTLAIGGAVAGDMADTMHAFRMAFLGDATSCGGVLNDMEVASLALDIYNRIREYYGFPTSADCFATAICKAAHNTIEKVTDV